MAAPVTTRAGHVIGGALVSSAGERIEVVNPATEEVIGTVPAGTAADVDTAVAAAAAAFPAWAARDPRERAAVVRRVAEGLVARRAEIAALITAEMGSPIGFATKVQASLPAATTAGIADLLEGGYAFTEEIGNSLVVREPIGVVGAITPWNYPLHQIAAKVAPALAAGNAVVLKPSEVAPLNANLFLEILAEAGVPDGVVNLVHGTGPVVGAAIAGHPGVDMVSFTGSTAAGKSVSALAAQTVKRVALELGGKSANVVLDDADLARAVKIGLANTYINGGQTCTAWTRLLVPADRHDEAVELAVAAAAKYTVGDPLDESTRIGPMASAAQRDRVLDYIRIGVEEGATLAHGGTTDGLPERGAYVPATIFAGVRSDMRIAQEEIFGPVLSILPYADEDEAVAIANSTVYGLAGAVFGADQDRAVAVARRLRTGQVDVNGGAFNPVAPFGGYKQSGNGRELGRFGLEEFLEVKSIQL
ncbi:aldehyde dehydrogenase family protein [Actinokineospora globicatena]|uniref:aldehyde dehydrogenase family protein n=1 Tax=Actinokineospora globicatena TaxID=103729 RepID=UPI0020A46E29|nr:aldehyde dehydrogenase family protein [Actinokineospora globicatena]MCP2305206.1 aldehyde dehydrogenase (NAD+) [Actinokineospora globicatena]GLW80681.1 aldehyde dehydrogenase [Actinokineospora globicatena]GLW87508.1 aldehyde dehydrogenase [Actinokineospora globicatena]